MRRLLFVVCVSGLALPVKWRPDLTMVVEWGKDPDPHASENWPPLGIDGCRAAYKLHAAKYTRHRVVAPVARYEELGLVNVHFLPCHQVAVSAGASYPGRPDYSPNVMQYAVRMLRPVITHRVVRP